MATPSETSICENCGEEIAESEVQKCGECDLDGLGNCCIGIVDHECEADE